MNVRNIDRRLKQKFVITHAAYRHMSSTTALYTGCCMIVESFILEYFKWFQYIGLIFLLVQETDEESSSCV